MNVDDAGKNLVLFNQRPPRVSILSTANFDLVASLGKQGRGPGELTIDNSWVGMRNNTLYVLQGHRTSLFALQGRELVYLDKDKTEKRTAMAMFRVDWTSGVDAEGRIYYWDEGLNGSHVVIRRPPNGMPQKLVPRKTIPMKPESFSDLAVRFGVHNDGAIVLAFGKEPYVMKTDSSGSVIWITNIVKRLPFLHSEYDAVIKKRIQFPITAFTTNEEYTILTFANPEQKIHQPRVLYVFLASKTGEVMRIAYAAENLRTESPSTKSDEDKSIAFVPSEICHAGKYLFVYSINSSRLRKYELQW